MTVTGFSFTLDINIRTTQGHWDSLTGVIFNQIKKMIGRLIEIEKNKKTLTAPKRKKNKTKSISIFIFMKSKSPCQGQSSLNIRLNRDAWTKRPRNSSRNNSGSRLSHLFLESVNIKNTYFLNGVLNVNFSTQIPGFNI